MGGPTPLIPGLLPESPDISATQSYNAVLPLLMKRYFGPGMIGLGVIGVGLVLVWARTARRLDRGLPVADV